MKKIKVIISIVLTAVLLASCSGEKAQADADKAVLGYKATYLVTTQSGTEYKNNYEISKNDGQIQISSVVCEPYTTKENGEEKTGEQVISSLILLNEQTLLPEKIDQTYTVSINAKLNSKLEASFASDQGYAMIKTNKKNSSGEEEEKAHTVAISGQYFDKDSLAFIIGALSEGDISIFSGNRDQLQQMQLIIEKEPQKVQTDIGEFDCTVYLIKPKTAFTVYGAKFFVDNQSGICVKVEQAASSMVITELAFDDVKPY